MSPARTDAAAFDARRGRTSLRSKQQVADITKALEKQAGNTNEDIVAAPGMQMRVAIFHDEKRENDLNEVHDGSDDIYYVSTGRRP